MFKLAADGRSFRHRAVPLILVIAFAAAAAVSPLTTAASASTASRRGEVHAARVAAPGVAAGAIKIDRQTVEASIPNVVTTDIDAGTAVSIRIPDAASPLVYSFRVAFGVGAESLALLPNGGVAVTAPLPATDVLPQSDDDPGDQSGVSDPPDVSGSAPTGTDDLEGVPVPDPTNYPDGAAVASARDGIDIVGDAPTGDGVAVAAAADPPTAVDATGRSVSVSLSLSGNRVVVTVAPPPTAVYPVSVSLELGFNGDLGTTLEANAPVPAQALTAHVAHVDSSCSPGNGAQFVVSEEHGWATLGHKLAAAPVCGTYYICIPSASGLTPNADASAAVAALNTARTAAAGALFVPCAVIKFNNVVGSFGDAGQRFASTMASRGYEAWAIDEAPYNSTVSPRSASWQNLVDLVTGLSSDGARGVVFNAYQHQDLGEDQLKAYKQQLQRVLETKSEAAKNLDWQTLSAAGALWGEESYTLCKDVCVNGATLAARAKHTNAYMQHLARLAGASDAPVGAGNASGFFSSAYFPLTNAWWATNTAQNGAYGTLTLHLAEIERLVSLELYSQRAWSGPGAGQRVGLRWDGQPPPTSTPQDDAAALAARIANALKAYSPAGAPIDACNTSAHPNNAAFCLPKAGGTFTSSWNIFSFWGKKRGTSGGGGGPTCPVWDGGPPANDGFANAEAFDTSNLLGSHSVSGAFDGATIEPNEVDVDALVGINPCTTVWYSLTAPTDDILQIYTNVRFSPPGQSPPFIAVWTGSALSPSSLTPVVSAWNNDVDFSSGNGMSNLSFNGTAGQTYLVQVGNVPDQDSYSDTFTLVWSRD